MTALLSAKMVRAILVALRIGAAVASGAANTDISGIVLVEDLGRRDALVFEGNKTFTHDQLLYALSRQIDFHFASHHLAPLSDFTAFLQRELKAAYQRAGFPDVTVEAKPDESKQKIVVHVNEGLRFRSGDIIVSGVNEATNKIVRQKILDTLLGIDATGPGLNSRLWRPGKPAPLDAHAASQLAARVQDALASLDYVEPTISVQVLPDRKQRVADLKVHIANEGIKGTIAEIEINGLRTNTRTQLLNYINLRPGAELHARTLTTVSNRLWQSGRFFRQNVSLSPFQGVGQFQLTIDLDEVLEVSPLGQKLSDNEAVLLKFREWMLGWEKRSEDLVISIEMTNSLGHYDAEMMLSPSGVAVSMREKTSNAPPTVHYAAVASERISGYYSVARQKRFTVPRAVQPGQISLQIRPPSPRSYGQGNIQLGFKLGVPASESPVKLELDFEPAVFLSLAYEHSITRKDGVLSLSSTLDEARQELQLDAATGRLLQFVQTVSGPAAFLARVQFKDGAFARAIGEVAAATSDHPNGHVATNGFASWLSFMTTELVESPLIERSLDEWSTESSEEDESAATGRRLKHIRSAFSLFREAMPEQSLTQVLEPLQQLWTDNGDDTEEDDFYIPSDLSPSQVVSSSMGMIAALALKSADNVFPPNSWPWILVRETVFSVFGKGQFTQAELDQLLASKEIGPLGCLATAYLTGKLDPRLARKFAELGLSRLTAAEFAKDYKVLMRTNSLLGAVTANALRAVSDAPLPKVAPLLTNLGPNEIILVQNLVKCFGADNRAAPSDAAWPAVEKYWNNALNGHVKQLLSRFLPQVQFLTNSRALYQRGLTLIADENAFQDFDEAAECFRKAAAQGHAGAQLQLGMLLQSGKGVPENYDEAMRWYREAAKNNEPHASCAIATLYHDGKGVRQDLDEAMKWYRREADGDCPRAQFNLARILEAQFRTEEALKWYRRAAEGGAAPAQARLGDMLSDGFSTTPNLIEACQWLLLATEAGYKLSGSRLGRLKPKLTVAQVIEAYKRKVAAEKNLEGQKKKRAQLEHATAPGIVPPPTQRQ